jgi:hypothetical protein
MNLQERTITKDGALRACFKAKALPLPLRERIEFAWRELGYTDPVVLEQKMSYVVKRVAEKKFKEMPRNPTAH